MRTLVVARAGTLVLAGGVILGQQTRQPSNEPIFVPGTAEIVGQKLRALGRNRQVLCVTHLAQVAAQGHTQIGVEKQVRDGTTTTNLRLLEEEARIGELARMLGGVEITEQSLAHAREMLEGAQRESPRRATG